MALIDTFLKLMLEKRAERLVMTADAVPYLIKAGETIELSMPAVRFDMLRRMGFEITGHEIPTGPQPSRREGSFLSLDGASFGYHIELEGKEGRIDVNSLSTPAPEEPVHSLEMLERMSQDDGEPDLPRPARPALPALAKRPPSAQPLPDLLAVIDQAISMDASDIFLSAGKPPRMRKNGVIVRIDAPEPDAAQILQLLPDDVAVQALEERGNADFAVRWELSSGPRRLRVNVFRHLDGVAAALRPVRRRIPSVSDLGLPDSILELANFASGLVLISGISGSGKSTTAALLLDHINRSRARHIITIEDPVEFEYREVQSLIHQREVGPNVESFSEGLRAALRENPDVILIGELRDLDTISAALTAAETGHLVIGTLHSANATSAISRIVDVFPGHQQAFIRVQLSSSLRSVISQRLLPTRDGRGLAPAIERLMVTPGVANGIREGHEHHIRNAMLTGTAEGMITLERSLERMVRSGKIDLETALQNAVDLKALRHLLE